jgi:hypothetical protein
MKNLKLFILFNLLFTTNICWASVLRCDEVFSPNTFAGLGAWKKISMLSVQKPEWTNAVFDKRKTRLLSLVDAGEMSPKEFLDVVQNAFTPKEQELLLLDFLVLGDPRHRTTTQDQRHKFLSEFQAQVTFERNLLLQTLGTPWIKLLNLKESSLYVEAAMDNDVQLIRALREAQVDIDINAWVLGPISKYTALTAAIEWGHVEVVRELLLFPDIDIGAKDPDNQAPMAIPLAKDLQQHEILILLLKQRIQIRRDQRPK